jgi:hypothetical protein
MLTAQGKQHLNMHILLVSFKDHCRMAANQAHAQITWWAWLPSPLVELIAAAWSYY